MILLKGYIMFNIDLGGSQRCIKTAGAEKYIGGVFRGKLS